MPVYERCVEEFGKGAPLHEPHGQDILKVIDPGKQAISRGFHCVRVQIVLSGMAGYAAGARTPVKGLREGPVFEPQAYIWCARAMRECCRKDLGKEIELLHDVHEGISPREALQTREGC